MRLLTKVALPVLAAGGLLLSGCSVPPPNITFFSAGAGSVNVAPLQYCDLEGQHCQANGAAAAALNVVPGRPVQISAPDEVASTLWQVAARFQDQSGNQYVSCSPLFTPDQRYAYTVNPQAGDQLVLIEVYQVAGAIYATPNGTDFEATARGTWVLTANGGKRVLPKPGDYLCAGQQSG